MTLDTFKTHLQATAGSGRTVLAYTADAERFEDYRASRPVTMDLYEAWVGTLEALRPQTVTKKRAAVNRWLAYLGRHGDDGAARTLGILAGGYKVGRRVRERDVEPVEPVTEIEYQAALGRAPVWGQHLMRLLWSSGARISEVIGDEIAGIPALTVGQGAQLVKTGHTGTVGKGGRRRLLILPSTARRVLSEWVDTRFGGLPDSTVLSRAPLFPSPQEPGRPVTAQAVNTMIHRAGLQHGAHAFRHSYKRRLRQAGVREEIIQALLGHGPRTTTDFYGRVTIPEMLAAVECLTG